MIRARHYVMAAFVFGLMIAGESIVELIMGVL